MENKKCRQGDGGRLVRLLKLVRDIRINPAQSLQNILKTYGISRSQFYNDKDTLAEMGFVIEYRKRTGFHILEDRLTPITNFSLSDRITLIFALESLSASGDGVLAAKAIEIGRKLAGGLESPLREQLLECFDNEITRKAYGVPPEIFQTLTEAVRERRRIRILYCRSGDWTERWRLIDPRRIYMRDQVLYLYARTVDENPPAWKVFRLNRIHEIQLTGTTFIPNPSEDDGFYERQKNAFSSFLGENTRSVTIRFRGEAIPYVKERLWHESQKLEEQEDGSLLFSVSVAEPMEVVRWSRQFGNNAEMLDMEDFEQ